jgi:hypothetical protein
VITLGVSQIRNWKTLFLLSIILPVGLLTTLKITGIIKEPLIIAQTTTLPLKERSFQRPYPETSVTMSGTLNATYLDSTISFSIHVPVFGYHIIWDVSPYAYVRLGCFLNVSTFFPAHLQSIIITFLNDSKDSAVDLIGTSIEPVNLTITSLKQAGGPEDFEKTHIELIPTNNSQSMEFGTIAEWSFQDISLDAEDHELEIQFVMTYYDGTAFIKLVQPFQLKILKSV